MCVWAVHASPEAALTVTEPPEEVATIPELSACPVTAMEVISELSACPVMGMEAVSEHSAGFVMATEAVTNLALLSVNVPPASP